MENWDLRDGRQKETFWVSAGGVVVFSLYQRLSRSRAQSWFKGGGGGVSTKFFDWRGASSPTEGKGDEAMQDDDE